MEFKIIMLKRIDKINELIKRQISEIITRELDLKPGVFLTVSRVDTAADFRYTRIFVSVFPEKDSEYALKTIQNEIYSLQGILNKKLRMKPLPRIEFKLDATEIEADKIEKILNSFH